MPENTQRVEVGQIWADNDKRSTGRLVRVVEVGATYATVEQVVPRGARHLHARPGRRSRIRINRFRPTSTGYRLVHPATEGEQRG